MLKNYAKPECVIIDLDVFNVLTDSSVVPTPEGDNEGFTGDEHEFNVDINIDIPG